MNLEKFLQHLANTKTKFDWVLYGKFGKIRSGSNCPITAVCESITGVKNSSGNFDRAAFKIGLSPELTDNIVVSADNSFVSSTSFCQNIRDQMLEALGLNNES